MAANQSLTTNTNAYHDGLQPTPPTLEPTWIQPHPLPRKRTNQSLRKKRFSINLTQTHPNLPMTNWKTHNNQPDLGKLHQQKTPTSNTSPIKPPLLLPPSNTNKNNPSELRSTPASETLIYAHRQTTTIDLPRRPTTQLPSQTTPPQPLKQQLSKQLTTNRENG
ncbi:hypothetical protein O181_023060 [Austropuccinia psidii MF-1]|uniref:Uncharacterized protein n=1 Tax=Austropuccinia psidii MF-1 TaxID=1389203 RepID=A0A9Q3CII3_9BASI|nr:hypothetical protein [Austropuccinia psidii MF-1]